MQTQIHRDGTLLECAGYFNVSGAALYTVLHEVADPVARVLLVGPFASERHFSYHPWVRWARYLAARGIEVLRYDYRGVGESTGGFEEMGFDHWSEDVGLLADWLSNRSQDVPLLLHGLEIGAILAARSFEQGWGTGCYCGRLPLMPTRHCARVLCAGQGWNSYLSRLRTGDPLRITSGSWSKGSLSKWPAMHGPVRSGVALSIATCQLISRTTLSLVRHTGGR